VEFKTKKEIGLHTYLNTKSVLERKISVTSLESKMGLKNRNMNAVTNSPVSCFMNIYTGSKT
jgi:hypothetical protein